jgi:cell division protein FtsQ
MPRAATRPSLMPRATAPAPADVRVMNQAASLVFVLMTMAALVAAVWWLMRSPLFPIRGIALEGDVQRSSVSTIRSTVQGGAGTGASTPLAGNFFSIDLPSARNAFEAVPWVRRAIVRRVWPDHLAVQLEEHHAAAFWESVNDVQAGDKLVNSHGEVFQANLGDLDDSEQGELPVLSGPEGAAAQMLALHRRLQPLLATLDLSIDKLTLSGRGSWRAELDSGAVIEIGRGSDAELLARAERFVRTLGQATAEYPQPLEYADLRHTDGYALRLRGVSTTLADAGPAAAAAAAAGKNKPRPTAAVRPRVN